MRQADRRHGRVLRQRQARAAREGSVRRRIVAFIVRRDPHAGQCLHRIRRAGRGRLHHGLRARTGGTVQCWGGNEKGQLGQGTLDEQRHPTPVTVHFD
ncbi:hypothetical protein [Labilithrix luteola]|uniref:hypothetical protein n=1 Tax=Labilithrix luteola TaxID=1391654 RepID=UPI003B831415